MWPRFNIKTIFPDVVIPMLKIRRSPDRLIFNMGIPILIRWHIYIEAARELFSCLLCCIIILGVSIKFIFIWHLCLASNCHLKPYFVFSHRPHKKYGHYNSAHEILLIIVTDLIPSSIWTIYIAVLQYMPSGCSAHHNCYRTILSSKNICCVSLFYLIGGGLFVHIYNIILLIRQLL